MRHRLLLIPLLLLMVAAAAATITPAAAESRPGPTLVYSPPDTPTPTPTETATPAPTSTPAPRSGPLLESLLSEYWWLPSSGNATPVAVWQAIGAASQAASYLDLTGNGHNITTGVEPAWSDAAGWTFNGTSHYLITDVADTTTMTWLVRFANYTGVGMIVGANTATAFTWLQPNKGGGQRQYRHSGGIGIAINISPEVSSGVMGIAGPNGYYNGIYDGSMAQAAAPNIPIYVGARNISGTPGSFAATDIQAVAAYANTLDATDVAEISANMAALSAATATPTPTATATATNTPTATATPTNTPAATNTPTATPLADYYIELPSGQQALISLKMTEGDRQIGTMLIIVAGLLLFGLLLQVVEQVRK